MNPKHILFVDDDPAIQDAVRMMLEHVGYTVTLMNDGDALLETGFTHPDLFILDKQLPGVDGLDICRHLKTQSVTAHIPVLILSASPQIRIQAKEACADSVLEKPFQMQALRKEVAQLISGTVPEAAAS
jgi:DNA-binding response OmpR family regulator